MARKQDTEHRRHRIKTVRIAVGYQARAFRGSNAVGDTVSGPTEAAAILGVRDLLDARAAELRARRGPGGFPCAEEVREALVMIRMNKAQEAMLQAHVAAPDFTLTATQLAQAAGYEDYAVANRQYGQLAHDLAMEMDWRPVEETNGVTTWTFTLADDADKDARKRGEDVPGPWRWRLRSGIIQALGS